MNTTHRCAIGFLTVMMLATAPLAEAQSRKPRAKAAPKGRPAAAAVKAQSRPADRPIALFGEIAKPGLIEFKPGMTVKDAVEAAGGFTAQADTASVTFRRLGASALGTLHGQKALEGDPIQNVALQPGDTLYVPRVQEAPRQEAVEAAKPVEEKPQEAESPKAPPADPPAQPAPPSGEAASAPQKADPGRFSIVGAVGQPGTFAYQENLSLKAVILAVGGLTKEADPCKIVVMRGMLTDPAAAQAIEYDYGKVVKGEHPDLTLLPGDVVQVPARGKKRGLFDQIGNGLKRLLPPKEVQKQIGDTMGRLVSTAALARAVPVVGSLIGMGEKRDAQIAQTGAVTRAAGGPDGQPTLLELALLEALQAEPEEVQQRVLNRVKARLQP